MTVDFTNHRKVEYPAGAALISVIKEGKIYNGWIQGRSLEEITEDFGEQNKDWFWTKRIAEKYLKENK